jgi:hypothetical protein
LKGERSSQRLGFGTVKKHLWIQLSGSGLAVPVNQQVILSLQTLFEDMHLKTEILSIRTIDK